MDSSCKKWLTVIVIILLLALVLIPVIRFATGLIYNSGKIFQLVSGLTPPYKQLGSLWISEEPFISLHVADCTSTIQNADAYVTRDGEKLEVDIFLEPGRPVHIQKKGYPSSDPLLTGEILNWSDTEVTIKVEVDKLFNGEYETITLMRVDP